MTRRAELLAPAGNPEKLRFAVDYGADAVYCALDRFGMRAAADNFTPESLAEGVHYAHERGVKVYVTLNTMPRDRELDRLPAYIAWSAGCGCGRVHRRRHRRGGGDPQRIPAGGAASFDAGVGDQFGGLPVLAQAGISADCAGARADD